MSVIRESAATVNESLTVKPKLIVQASVVPLGDHWYRVCSSTLPAPSDRLTRFFVCRLTPFCLALVPVLLAFRQSQLHLHPTIAEVQPRWDQRQSLLLRLADEFMQLILVHQQLPGTQGFMVEDVAVFVRTDVRVDQPEFAIFHQPVGVLEVSSSGAHGFHFGSAQGDAGFELLQQKVVVRRGAVDRSVPLSAGRRIAPWLLFLLGTACGGRVTNHKYPGTTPAPGFACLEPYIAINRRTG